MFAAIIAIALSSASTAVAEKATVLIACDININGRRAVANGTGFGVRGDRLITADHVLMGDARCHVSSDFDNNGSMKIVSRNASDDIAIFDAYGSTLDYACDDIRPGETYVAIGYANGKTYNTFTVTAVDMPLRGHMPSAPQIQAETLKVVKGELVHGTSGGPVLDRNGKAVGVVIAYNETLKLSFVRQLKDTAICQSGKE